MKQNPLNDYARKMADYNLEHNPTAQEVILVLNNESRDHYQDAVSCENYRVKKRVIVKKEPDLHYVQFDKFDSLMEDTKNLPWTVSMTLTGIQRYEYNYETYEDELVDSLPRTDDQILMDGKLYTISMVEPSNRYLDGIVNCFIYPERSSPEDPFAIYRVERIRGELTDRVYSIVWGGEPTHYSFDEVEWLPFTSYIRCVGAIQPNVLYIKDKFNNVESVDLPTYE